MSPPATPSWPKAGGCEREQPWLPRVSQRPTRSRGLISQSDVEAIPREFEIINVALPFGAPRKQAPNAPVQGQESHPVRVLCTRGSREGGR